MATKKTEANPAVAESKVVCQEARNMVDVFIPYSKEYEDVTVGVNGKIYKIQPGYQKVPEEVAEVIENSQRQDNSTRRMIQRMTARDEFYGTM